MRMLYLSAMLVSISALADTFHSSIYSFDEKYGVIRFSNGRVAYLNNDLKSLRLKLKSFLQTGTNLKVHLSDDYELLTLSQAATQASLQNEAMEDSPGERPTYEPTILPGMSAAQAMFDRLNPDYKRISECSDRAHVWSFEEFKQHQIKSMKAFVFFTASYINRNRFKWWFHVAPMVQVRENNTVVPKILDFRYMDGPASVKEWTDMMVSSKRACKVTDKFSEYDVNPQTEDCYLIFESMYYRLPGDIHQQETLGRFKNSFYQSEVGYSLQSAFKQSLRSVAHD